MLEYISSIFGRGDGNSVASVEATQNCGPVPPTCEMRLNRVKWIYRASASLAVRKSKSVSSRLLFIGLGSIWESAESVRCARRCVAIVVNLMVRAPRGVLKARQVTRAKATYTVQTAVSDTLTRSPNLKRACVSWLDLGGGGSRGVKAQSAKWKQKRQ